MSLVDGNGGLTAADVAAVVGNGNNGFGFGGDGAWWLIVLFLFAFSGNGFGNNFGGGGGAMQRGFDQSAVMNGLAGIQSSLASAEVSRCNAQANILQTLNGLGANVADLKYTVATEACADRAAVESALRDVIASNTANTQMILDKLCQQEIEALKTKVNDLQMQSYITALRDTQNAQTQQLIADNAAQTAALEQYLNPSPIPAYTVPNPNCCPQYNRCCG